MNVEAQLVSKGDKRLAVAGLDRFLNRFPEACDAIVDAMNRFFEAEQ